MLCLEYRSFLVVTDTRLDLQQRTDRHCTGVIAAGTDVPCIAAATTSVNPSIRKAGEFLLRHRFEQKAFEGGNVMPGGYPVVVRQRFRQCPQNESGFADESGHVFSYTGGCVLARTSLSRKTFQELLRLTSHTKLASDLQRNDSSEKRSIEICMHRVQSQG